LTSHRKKKLVNERHQWLRECHVAFSPLLNLLVTAFDQQIVVSTGKSPMNAVVVIDDTHRSLMFISKSGNWQQRDKYADNIVRHETKRRIEVKNMSSSKAEHELGLVVCSI
jgi:hypothetical protein